MPQTRYCSRHPDTATSLGCSKCGQAICPRCMVQTPVGARCRECAQVRRLPTFDVGVGTAARATVVSLVLGVAGGVGFVFLSGLLYRIWLLDILALVAIGYIIGQGVSSVANRKRGRALQFIAAAGMLVAYVIIVVNGPVVRDLIGLIGLFIAFYVAISRLR